MEGLIISVNAVNGYCGFDRDYSYWNQNGNLHSRFTVIEDYFAPLSSLEEVLNLYSGLKKSRMNYSLIGFSTNHITNECFQLIGYDCGYVYDENSCFYPGFSTISNEILRMNNKLCRYYKQRLNDALLFEDLSIATEYSKKRSVMLQSEESEFETAFSPLVTVSIYKFVDNMRLNHPQRRLAAKHNCSE